MMDNPDPNNSVININEKIKQKRKCSNQPRKRKFKIDSLDLDEEESETGGYGSFLSTEVKELLVNYKRSRESRNPFDSAHQKIIEKFAEVAKTVPQMFKNQEAKANLTEAALLLDCSIKVFVKQTLSLKKEVEESAKIVTSCFTQKKPDEEPDHDNNESQAIVEVDGVADNNLNSTRPHSSTVPSSEEFNTSSPDMGKDDSNKDKLENNCDNGEPTESVIGSEASLEAGHNEVEAELPPLKPPVEIITIDDDDEDELMNSTQADLNVDIMAQNLGTSQLDQSLPNFESGMDDSNVSLNDTGIGTMTDISMLSNMESTINAHDLCHNISNESEAGDSMDLSNDTLSDALNETSGNDSNKTIIEINTSDPAEGDIEIPRKKPRMTYSDPPTLSLPLPEASGDYVGLKLPPLLTQEKQAVVKTKLKKVVIEVIQDSLSKIGNLSEVPDSEEPNMTSDLILDLENQNEMDSMESSTNNEAAPELSSEIPNTISTTEKQQVPDPFENLLDPNVVIKTEPTDEVTERILTKPEYDALPGNNRSQTIEFTEEEQAKIQKIGENLAELLVVTSELSGDQLKSYSDAIQGLKDIFRSHQLPFNNQHLLSEKSECRRSVDEPELFCTPQLRNPLPDSDPPLHETFFQEVNSHTEDESERSRLTVMQLTSEKNKRDSDHILTKLLVDIRKQVVSKFVRMPLIMSNTEAFFRRVRDFENKMKKVLEAEAKKEQFDVTKYKAVVIDVTNKETQEPCEETSTPSTRSSLSEDVTFSDTETLPLDIIGPLSPSPSSVCSEGQKWVSFRHLFHHMEKINKEEISRIFYTVLDLLSQKGLDMKYDNHITEASKKNKALKRLDLEQDSKHPIGSQIVKAQCADMDEEEIYIAASLSRDAILRQHEARPSESDPASEFYEFNKIKERKSSASSTSSSTCEKKFQPQPLVNCSSLYPPHQKSFHNETKKSSLNQRNGIIKIMSPPIKKYKSESQSQTSKEY